MVLRFLLKKSRGNVRLFPGRRIRENRKVKDRLFRELFAKDKEALLQLYNALNGTNYEDSEALE